MIMMMMMMMMMIMLLLLMLIRPTFVFRKRNSMCGRFQFPCHLSIRIPSSKAHLVFVIVSDGQKMVWLSVLGIFNERTDDNAYDFTQRCG